MIPAAEVFKQAHRLGVGDLVVEKDYVLSWLLEWGDVDLSFLPSSFGAKCRHKGQEPDRLDEVLARKEATFDKLWASRLAVQIPELPHLNEVMRVVRRHLRGLELM